jgi:putative intracellular protease/amidase
MLPGRISYALFLFTFHGAFNVKLIMKKLFIFLATALFIAVPTAFAAEADGSDQSPDADAPRVLFILTSHGALGDTGKETGFYLSEATHPYRVLKQAGIAVDFASPNGGKAPVDPKSMDLEDPVNKAVMEDEIFTSGIKNTMKLTKVDPSKYDAVYYPGGHGTMWDFPENEEIQEITREVYEGGGVIGAVCHGPAALVNVTLEDGSPLLQGKRVAAFTNEEEKAVELADTVPFLLADKLEEAGAEHVPAENWAEQVIVDERLVTGQNPSSATKLGEKMVELIKENSQG